MKNILVFLALLTAVPMQAWWDPGHMVIAMIAFSRSSRWITSMPFTP